MAAKPAATAALWGMKGFAAAVAASAIEPKLYWVLRLPPVNWAVMYPLNFTQVSEPGRVQPVMPPTLQTLTYSTGAAFLVGRSAACALATATKPAAEPSRRLLMSVICDLQLDVVGVGFLLAFDFPGPPTARMKFKAISPLFPFDLSIVALPLQMPAIFRDRESPAHLRHH